MGAEELAFVHRFLPAQEEQQKTVLLMLHGTGGEETTLLDLGRILVPGSSLLSPRGKVLEQGKCRFFRRWADGTIDVEDLTARTHELADFIEAASERYAFPLTRVIAVGYSNGATIATSMLLLHPHVLSAAILLHSRIPFWSEVVPRLSGKPIFIGGGRTDPIVPGQHIERLEELFRLAGADVTVHWHRGGHQLSYDGIRTAKAWLRSKLQVDAANRAAVQETQQEVDGSHNEGRASCNA